MFLHWLWRVNAVTQRDLYPILHIDECIDSIEESTVSSTSLANSGHFQEEIGHEDDNKAAFIFHLCLCRFIRTLFGLKKTPGTFQRAINVLFAPLAWQTALMSMDVIAIFSKIPEERINHVKQAQHKNCRFFFKAIDYLVHVIRPQSLEAASHTTDVIEQLNEPCNATELRSFFGLSNVFESSSQILPG